MENRKIFLVSVCVLFFSIKALSQTKEAPSGSLIYFDISATYIPTGIEQTDWLAAPDTAVYQIFDYINSKPRLHKNKKVKTTILTGVKLNASLNDFRGEPVKLFSHSYSTFLIKDGSEAEVIALGINDSNIKEYEYRVVENDSTELQPWSPIPALQQKYGAKKSYGLIGKFKSPGKQILVEIKNKKNYGIRDGVIFDWRTNYKPVAKQLVLVTKNKFFNLLDVINNGYADNTKSQITGLPGNIRLPLNDIVRLDIDVSKPANTILSFFLIGNTGLQKDTLQLNSGMSESFWSLDSIHFNQLGKYELIIQPQGSTIRDWPESQQLRLPFEVIPPPVSSAGFTGKQLFLIIAAALSGAALLFGVYYVYQKRKVKKLSQAEQSARLKLQSIRSQLNPHFIFNALSSVQSLANKHETEKVNQYLQVFASLTRSTLESSSKALTSIEEELKLLRDYLTMEQLRFGFKYDISVDETLDIANLEIPPMLLQPFVENAVKYGMAGKNDGHIQVRFVRRNQHIEMSVQDNGKGFNGLQPHDGFGIKLSREKIDLLNLLYPKNKFSLHMQSNETGALVLITIHDWI